MCRPQPPHVDLNPCRPPLSAAGAAAEGAPLPASFANKGGPPFLFIGLAYLSNTTSGFGANDGAVAVFENGTYAMHRLLADGVHVERGAWAGARGPAQQQEWVGLRWHGSWRAARTLPPAAGHPTQPCLRPPISHLTLPAAADSSYCPLTLPPHATAS